MNRRISILLAYAMGVLCHGVDAAELAPAVRGFLDRHCAECHDSDLHKGGLDLTALTFDLENPKSFAQWVKVHDRVRDGEMPPKKKPRPDPDEMSSFLEGLGAPMRAADEARATREGRSTWRRLNRYEYENTVRELLQAPWLEIRTCCPRTASRIGSTNWEKRWMCRTCRWAAIWPRLTMPCAR
jgi:hypothetical protein